MEQKIKQILTKIPLSLQKPSQRMYFGTAGYRTCATKLLSTLCRSSLVACFRSKRLRKVVGVMVTASHNKSTDNGIKIIDSSGDYISTKYELYCDELVNCEDKNFVDTLIRIYNEIVYDEKNGNDNKNDEIFDGVVALGRDTRESGAGFINEISSVLSMFGCKVIDYEVVSTPQLHFLVRECNSTNAEACKSSYTQHLSKWYKCILENVGMRQMPVFVDTAHGVAEVIIKKLLPSLDGKHIDVINSEVPLSKEQLQIELSENEKICCKEFDRSEKIKNLKMNGLERPRMGFKANRGLLNLKCGADYIVTNNRPPQNLNISLSDVHRCVSFDGDADRLVYFITDPCFLVINGDRMNVFLVDIFYHLLYKLNLLPRNDKLKSREIIIGDENTKNGDYIDKRIFIPKFGAVFSHYSNSAAINAIRKKTDVVVANTGVKNFIREARKFDIGVYFEPNGHGSVYFSENFKNFLQSSIIGQTLCGEEFQCAQTLLALSNLFDPCVGDAIANFLALESLFDENTWEKMIKMYTELPTKLTTVKILNKHCIETEDEIKVKNPVQLGNKIDELCKKYNGRAFVRPSGTEDLVRVFSECETKENCDKLSGEISQAVYDLCGGIGDRPLF
ncbi:hypothetical protein EDEG_02496 [Edhazardia aedis USNM 41457]|uniref:Phosphoacetylglucosamine mutase n=1 Tax=Edhazardia aedis (strain USNM 41457) TaxID=1003232 RepID=J9DKL5_EDHAE|nr:hypothetical protein EDEG_02496 [Edhazardia aedis USNM 41457]|eukprot:EJW03125.1 hypothetical protein EDEG_02496 [Edhazardia aedis USNM 41457]